MLSFGRDEKGPAANQAFFPTLPNQAIDQDLATLRVTNKIIAVVIANVNGAPQLPTTLLYHRCNTLVNTLVVAKS